MLPEQLASLDLPEMQAATAALLPPPTQRPPDDTAARSELRSLAQLQQAHNQALGPMFAPDGLLHGKVHSAKLSRCNGLRMQRQMQRVGHLHRVMVQLLAVSLRSPSR